MLCAAVAGMACKPSRGEGLGVRVTKRLSDVEAKGAVQEFRHRTVLLDEAIDALAIDGERRSGVYVDGTFGRGGHSGKILEKLDANGRLIAFDKDPQAIATA